jgi:hypothetical protein
MASRKPPPPPPRRAAPRYVEPEPYAEPEQYAEPEPSAEVYDAQLKKLNAEPAYEPERVRTIVDEQRERSEEMQRMGVEAWKAANDQRTPEQMPQPVEGVTQLPADR